VKAAKVKAAKVKAAKVKAAKVNDWLFAGLDAGAAAPSRRHR
jgi:hypothetical protein